MIKVCLHSEVMSRGGVIHHVKNKIKYIDRSKFDVFLATTDKEGPYFQAITSYIKPENIFLYPRETNIHTWNLSLNRYPDAPLKHPLYQFLEEKHIDILHDYRGGEPIFPFNSRQIKVKKVETNIFAGADIDFPLDLILCISQGVFNSYLEKIKTTRPDLAQKAKVLPLSIDEPASSKNLRKELNISENTIVIGRASNFYVGDVINFQAYKQIESSNTMFLALNISNRHKEMIKSLGIKNIQVVEPIDSYERMSMYYNTLDIEAHNSGESFGCAVAEAIMHQVPVVTVGWNNFQYNFTNAHQELILDPAYCTQGTNDTENTEAYSAVLKKLILGGRDYCKDEGKKMKDRIFDKIYAPRVVARLETLYEKLLTT